jgi:hypothetical protein
MTDFTNQPNIQEIRELIFCALGEAAMCWIPTPSDSKFNSQKMIGVGERLIRDLFPDYVEPFEEGLIQLLNTVRCNGNTKKVVGNKELAQKIMKYYTENSNKLQGE